MIRVLTEPPSSVHCFRDVTLYSESILWNNENIIDVPEGDKEHVTGNG